MDHLNNNNNNNNNSYSSGLTSISVSSTLAPSATAVSTTTTTTTTPSSSSSSSSSCTALLDDAISCMSYNEKEAFVHVIECNPNIVLQETDPSYIIQFEQYNIWDAAKRITNYWRWKKRIFGSERYIRDLFDLSGYGALDLDDIILLNTGYVANTPPTNDGISVLVFDRSKLGTTDWELIDANRNYRTGFYGIALAAQEQKHLYYYQQQQQRQQQSSPPPPPPPTFILINLIHTMPKFIQNAKDFADIIYETSPVRLKYNHTIFLTQSDYVALFLRMVIPAVDLNLRRIFPTLTLTLFTSIHEAITKLQHLGFRPDSLPSSLGGTWQYNTISIANRIMSASTATIGPTLVASTSTTSMDQSLLQQQQQQQQQQPYSNNSQSAVFHTHNQALLLLSSSSSSSLLPNDDIMSNRLQQQQQQEQQQSSQLLLIDDPLLDNFIQYNKNDTEQVRKHIQVYTNLRQTLFQNRSNLPITQTGFGALTTDDITLLNTGFLMILPNDLSGNSVIVLELCKVESSNIDSIRRCYFYILSVLLLTLTEQQQNGMTEQQQRNKIVLFAFVNDIKSDRLRDSLVLSDITEAFPVEISFTHIFIHPFGLGWLTFQSKAEALISTVLNVPEQQRSVHILDDEYRYDESFIVTFNMQKEYLPIQLGGNWSYETSYRTWQQQRIIIESNSNDYNNNNANNYCNNDSRLSSTTTSSTSYRETILDPIGSNNNNTNNNNNSKIVQDCRVGDSMDVSTNSCQRNDAVRSNCYNMESVVADKVTSTVVLPHLIRENSQVHPTDENNNNNNNTNNNDYENTNNTIIIVDDTTIPILDEPSECFSINTQLFDEDGNHQTSNNRQQNNINNNNKKNNSNNDTKTPTTRVENCMVGFYVHIPNIVHSS